MPDLVLRVKLAALWAALMVLYLYADVFMLFPQGHIDEIVAGRMGPYEVTQSSLLLAALLMAIPAIMVALSTFLPTALCRRSNVLLGIL